MKKFALLLVFGSFVSLAQANINPCETHVLYGGETETADNYLKRMGYDSLRYRVRCNKVISSENTDNVDLCLFVGKNREGENMAFIISNTRNVSLNAINGRDNETVSEGNKIVTSKDEWEGVPYPFGRRDKFTKNLQLDVNNKTLNFSYKKLSGAVVRRVAEEISFIASCSNE